MFAWIERMPPWLAALPWLLGSLSVYMRLRQSRCVTEYEPRRGPDAPRVSVIVPARNEARNIERCVRSLLATTYPNLELIIVDDHSDDGTGALAQRMIGTDARARITSPAALPAGWFGKQWACWHAAALATGDLLLFTDADTWHAPDLVGRAVAALETRRADLLSIVGHLETESFWEGVVQPAMGIGFFAIFGGTEAISRTARPRRKLVSGQYMLVRRDSYDALDGHRAVHAFVAEDVMMGQRWTAAGLAVHMVSAVDHLRTRMYRSLREIVDGWGKNVWAGGRHMLGTNAVVLALGRTLSPLTPWTGVIPVIAITLGVCGALSSWWIWFGGAAYAYQTAVWGAFYARMRARPAYALLYPLACVTISYIFARAAVRGSRTSWKGREYRAA